jgi:acylglycerol lipase
VLHLKHEQCSRDPEEVERMNADPLIAHETQPAETIAALARADEQLKQSFGRITLPVFILHGTADNRAVGSSTRRSARPTRRGSSTTAMSTTC